jgi:molybdate transport system substrate-binding protein
MLKTTRPFVVLIFVSGVLGLTLSPLVPRQVASAANTRKIVVYAAASLANALDELRSQFARAESIDVQPSYASSALLAQQIANGADADLYISADEKWADYLAERKLVGERRDLLGNRLVVIVPADSPLRITKLEDLATPSIEHLALGDPQSVPAGQYARQALTKAGVWQQVRERVVAAEDVRHALTYVETGAAEAGIVYATDAALSKKTKVAIRIPADLSEPIRYPLVLLKNAADQQAAAEFYRYLVSPAAAKIFEKHGFVVLEGGAQ